jgi:hypothetical protein
MKLRMESSRSVGKYPEYISEVSLGWFKDSNLRYITPQKCQGLGKVILLHTKLRNQRNMEIDCKIWVEQALKVWR